MGKVVGAVMVTAMLLMAILVIYAMQLGYDGDLVSNAIYSLASVFTGAGGAGVTYAIMKHKQVR